MDERSAPAATTQAVWQQLSRACAAVAVLLLGLRIALPYQLTVGVAVGLALIPVWLPALSRFRGARTLLACGVGLTVVGGLLTYISAADHEVSDRRLTTVTIEVLGLLVGIGVVLWARTQMHDGWVAAWFGAGMLLGVERSSSLFADNPWRFGFSVAVAVLALGLVGVRRRRWAELTVLLALIVASVLSDARSGSAMLLLTAVLVAWQARPTESTRRGSALWVLAGLAVSAFAVYSIGQALIIEGALGDDAQARTLKQINTSGSVILGGRPEMAATAALMQDQPWGFGSGTLPSRHDIGVAKSGLQDINFDPDIAYVDEYMFGSGYELHSLFGDLWADFGLLGLAFCFGVLVLVLRGVAIRVASRTASALLVWLGFKTLWNLFFSPFYSSVPLLMLTLGLVLFPVGALVVDKTTSRAAGAPHRPSVLPRTAVP